MTHELESVNVTVDCEPAYVRAVSRRSAPNRHASLGSGCGLPVFRGDEIGTRVAEKVVQIQRKQANRKPIEAIARDLRLSRTCVQGDPGAKNALDLSPRGSVAARLELFQERLDTLLTEREVGHRRDRLRMTRILDLWRCKLFPVSHSAVRGCARRWPEARRRGTVERETRAERGRNKEPQLRCKGSLGTRAVRPAAWLKRSTALRTPRSATSPPICLRAGLHGASSAAQT